MSALIERHICMGVHHWSLGMFIFSVHHCPHLFFPPRAIVALPRENKKGDISIIIRIIYLSSSSIIYPGVGSPSSVASSSSTSGTQAGPGSNPLSRDLRSRQFFSPLSEKGGVENGEKDIAAAIFSPLSEKGDGGDRGTALAFSFVFLFSFFFFLFRCVLASL